LLQAAGGAVGFAADLFGYYRMTGGGLPTKFIDAGAQAVAANIGGKVPSWLVGTLVPEAARAGAEGLIGVMRENLLEQNAQDSIGKVARTFGVYAAGDLAFNIGLRGAWSFAKMAGRGLVRNNIVQAVAERARRGVDNQFWRGAVPKDEWDETLELFGKGSLPQERRVRLSQNMQDRIAWTEAIQDAKRMETLEDQPLLKTQVALTSVPTESGPRILVQADEGYRFVDPEKLEVTTFGTLREANEHVAEIVARRARELRDEPEELSKFLQGKEDILRYVHTPEAIDASLDVLKRIDSDSATAKAIRQMRKQRGYTPEWKRGAITRTEADTIHDALEGSAYVDEFSVPLSDDMRKALRKKKPAFESGRTVQLRKGEDNNVLAVLNQPATDPNEIAAAQRLAERAQLSGARESVEELVDIALIEKGYDGMVLSDGTVRAFFPEKLKVIDADVNPMTGAFSSKRKSHTESFTGLPNRAYVSRRIRQFIGPEELVENEDVLLDIAEGFTGKLDRDEVERFAKTYLAGRGVQPKNVRAKMVDSDGFVTIERSGDGVTVRVPERIDTPSARERFTRTLFRGLSDAGDEIGDAGRSFDTGRIAQRETPVWRPARGVDEEKWVRDVVERELDGQVAKTQSGYRVELAGKDPKEFESVGDLVDYVALETMDFSTLKVDLAQKGLQLQKGRDGIYRVTGKNRSVIAAGESLREVMDDMGYRPDQIDIRYGPQRVVVTEQGVGVEYEQGLVMGGRQAVSNFLQKFADYGDLSKLRREFSSADGDIFRKPSGQYKVTMPGLGVTKQFDDLSEARRFIENDWQRYDNLKRIAERKGFSFAYEKGIYKARNVDGEYSAQSLEELQRIMRTFPDIDAAPGLFDDLPGGKRIHRDTEEAAVAVKTTEDGAPMRPNTLTEQMENGEPQVTKENSFGLGSTLGSTVQQMTDFVERTFRKIPGHEELVKHYRDMELNRQVLKTDIDRGSRLAFSAFTRSDGSLIEYEKRRGIHFLLDVWSDAQKRSDVIENFDLGGEEIRAAEQLRELYDSLGTKFGIDPQKIIYDYSPRVRAFAERNGLDVVNEADTADALNRKIYGNAGLSRDVQFWAEHERVNDVVRFAQEEDSLKVFLKYNSQGHKKFYLNDSWRQIDQYMKRVNKKGSGKALPSAVNIRLNHYRDMVMGTFTTLGERSVEEIGMQFMRALGKTDKESLEAGRNLLRHMMSVQVLTNLAYRPWIAIRNLFQVFTTLAPRIGNTHVMKAIRDVAETTDEQYRYLKELGVIHDAPPIVNELSTRGTLLGKAVQRGLNLFKNSDDLTRMVAYRSAVNRFDEGLSKFNRGVIKSQDDLLEYTAMNTLEPDVVADIRRRLSSGQADQIAGARDAFATRVVEDSMFLYDRAQSPLYTHSLVGRLFGQYGTYSAGYRANIYRNLKNGTAGQKTAFMMRFLGNQAALWGSFTAMGVNAQNFFPFAPALFSGGPMFDTALNVIRSFDTGYQGQQARYEVQRQFSPVNLSKLRRGELEFQVPASTPIYQQARMLNTFIEQMEKGNTWTAYLALTGAPIRPDLR
jgi:hypothetical protein